MHIFPEGDTYGCRAAASLECFNAEMLNPDARLRLMPSLTDMVAVVLLGGGVFLVQPASLSAQEQPVGTKSPGQEERAAKPEDQSKAKAKEAEKEAKDRYSVIRGYEEAAKMLPPAAGAPECVWTGQRIASLLWRDDVGTASRYMDLYKQFDCSPEHLKLAFRCVVKQGPINLKAAEDLASRVRKCWLSPEGPEQATDEAANAINDGTKSK
jgi:hypothetical protein